MDDVADPWSAYVVEQFPEPGDLVEAFTTVIVGSGGGEPDGGAACVREPRRPVVPSSTSGAAAD